MTKETFEKAQKLMDEIETLEKDIKHIRKCVNDYYDNEGIKLRVEMVINGQTYTKIVGDAVADMMMWYSTELDTKLERLNKVLEEL